MNTAAVGTADFVNVDVLAVGQESELGHSRAGRVVVIVDNIVNKRGPR